METYNNKNPIPVTLRPNIQTIVAFNALEIRDNTQHTFTPSAVQKAAFIAAESVQIAAVNTLKASSTGVNASLSILNNSMDMYVNGATSAPLVIASAGAASEKWYTGAGYPQLLVKPYNITAFRVVAASVPDEGAVTVRIILVNSTVKL